MRKISVAWQFFTQTAHLLVKCGIEYPSEWVKNSDLRFDNSRCVEMGKGRAAYSERRDEMTRQGGGRTERKVEGCIKKEAARKESKQDETK